MEDLLGLGSITDYPPVSLFGRRQAVMRGAAPLE